MSGWTWLDYDVFKDFDQDTDEGVIAMENEQDRREKLIVPIVARINAMQKEQDNENLIHGMRYGYYDDQECYEPEYDSEEEAELARIMNKSRDDAKQAAFDAEMNSLLDSLNELGARMMRPYEHWNEDEKLMEYLERDRGYDY